MFINQCNPDNPGIIEIQIIIFTIFSLKLGQPDSR